MRGRYFSKILALILILLLIQGDYKLYSQLVDLKTHLKVAVEEFKQGKYRQALERLERVLAYVPEEEKELRAKMLVLIGACYEKLKKEDRALSLYSRAFSEVRKAVEIEGLDLWQLKVYRKYYERARKYAKREEKKAGIILKEGKKKRGFPLVLLAGAAALLAVGSYLAFRKGGFLNKGTAEIYLTSEPSGAEVYINGNGAGKTPLELKLDPGEYTIKLTLKGYGGAIKKFSFEGHKKYRIFVKLSPFLYRLVKKWGANYFVDMDINGSYLYGATWNKVEKYTKNGSKIFSNKIYLADSMARIFGASGIAIGNSKIYIADSDFCSIQIFSLNGSYLGKWGDYSGNLFPWPNSVAVDRYGYIYVTNEFCNCVKKLNSSGSVVRSWGTAGSGAGQFSNPYDIAVSDSDYVFVGDRGNKRVQKFNIYGKFVSEIKLKEDPGSIALDDRNKIIYVETSKKIYKYDFDGSNESEVKVKNVGYITGDLAVDGEGKLYVEKSGQIWVLELTNETEEGEWSVTASPTLIKPIELKNKKFLIKQISPLKNIKRKKEKQRKF